MEPASDVCGTLSLVNPQLLSAVAAEWALEDARTPTLMVLEALADKGWTGGIRSAAHTRDDKSRIFDAKDVFGNKKYLQCVLSLESLFAQNMPGLHLKQLQSYYDVALKLDDLGGLVPRLKAISYQRMLAIEDGTLAMQDQSDTLALADKAESADEEVWTSLSVGAHAHERVKRAKTQTTDSLEGVLWQRARPALAHTPASHTDADASISQTTSAVGVVAPELSVPAELEVDDEEVITQLINTPTRYPDFIEGQRCKVETHGTPGSRGYYKRLIVRCPLASKAHSGGQCEYKKRNVGQAQTIHYGELEPVAFLGVWLREGRVGHILYSR